MYKTTEKVPLLSPDSTSLRAGEIKPWLTTNQSLVIVRTQATDVTAQLPSILGMFYLFWLVRFYDFVANSGRITC